jgi:hypothetical protein
MRAWLYFVWLPPAIIAGGCQQSTPTPATIKPPEQPGRVEQADNLARDQFEGLDPLLVKDIREWKKGDPPPARLLHFPNGPPADFPLCGMRALGHEGGDFIGRVTDPDLLAALLFDGQADAACMRSAARRLLELRGVKHLRAVLSARRKTNPADFNGSELATLTQLLASPYARVRVASLDKKDATKEAAEKALVGLKADLAAGVPWGRAYRAAADLLFDKVRSEKEGGGWRTFLCYRYDGLISPAGFDVLDRRISKELPPDHIGKLFEAKTGVHRLETAEVYWLYYVEAFTE